MDVSFISNKTYCDCLIPNIMIKTQNGKNYLDIVRRDPSEGFDENLIERDVEVEVLLQGEYSSSVRLVGDDITAFIVCMPSELLLP